MTTFDEQMAAIERLAGMRGRALPYEVKRDPDLWLCDDNAEFVASIETHRQGIRNHDVNNAAYLVACANAAPDLVAEIRRLREGNAYLMKRYTDACMSLSEALERVEELEGGETA